MPARPHHLDGSDVVQAVAVEIGDQHRGHGGTEGERGAPGDQSGPGGQIGLGHAFIGPLVDEDRIRDAVPVEIAEGEVELVL